MHGCKGACPKAKVQECEECSKYHSVSGRVAGSLLPQM